MTLSRLDLVRCGRGALTALVLTLALGACAVGPHDLAPQLPAPARWYAPLPHDGRVTALADWWQQFDDPTLDRLIKLAEHNSPSLTGAWASIERARATLASAEARVLPQVDGRGGVARSRQRGATGAAVVGSARSAGADASWELDVFGKARRQAEGARARVAARVDDWHDARVSLAAAVADTYVQYRACSLLAQAYAREVQSTEATRKATAAAVRGGFSSAADEALAEASLASARATLVQQRGQCELLVKSLVALSGQPEPALRKLLEQHARRLPQPAAIAVQQLPAASLRQRPDVAAREQELLAAAADIGVARADFYPSLSLSGSITVSAGSLTPSFTSWSFGPSLSIPIFDGGRRRAALAGAEADYLAALARYQQTVRDAVKEVEHALVNLHSTQARADEARRASAAYRRYFTATERHWREGGESLLDLEQARRLALSAVIQEIQLRRDRVQSWIALYKALGGGWQAGEAARPPELPQTQPSTQARRNP